MRSTSLAPRARLRHFAFALGLLLLMIGAFGAANASAYLYWTEYGGGLVNRTRSSGPEETVKWVSGLSELLQVAVGPGHVYWSDWDGDIGRANLEGREVEPEWIKTGSRANGVAVDAGHVYWASFETNSIGRANLAGGEVEKEWIKGANTPRGLAVDAGHVYWASAALESIGRANLAGGEVEPVWIPVSVPEGLAVGAGHVYWGNFGTDSIGRANLAGGEVEPLFIADATFPRGLAVGTAHLYWANQGTSSIGRANLDGGGVEPEFRKVSPANPASWVFGLAVGSQKADPSPTSLDFGSIVRGSPSAPQTVTFTNRGNQNLSFRGLALAGTDPGQFLLEAGGCAATVPPGGSCTVGVRFLPQAVGAFSATLTAQTNGETDPVVPLAGTGSKPALRPPNTSFAKGPAGRSANRRPSFVFRSNQAGSTFRCRLDKQKFRTCRARLTLSVKPGHHVMRVKAVGPTGLVDPTAAKRSFVVVRAGGAARLSAASPAPVLGGWKGETTQGLPIYFGVREGGVVTNVRVNYRDAICGRASIHKRNLRLSVDEGGRFAGVVYPANGGVEVEGSFTDPRRVTGRIVAGEASGLPGCAGGSFSFTAAPKR